MDETEVKEIEMKLRVRVVTALVLCFGGILLGMGKLLSVFSSLIGQ